MEILIFVLKYFQLLKKILTAGKIKCLIDLLKKEKKKKKPPKNKKQITKHRNSIQLSYLVL